MKLPLPALARLRPRVSGLNIYITGQSWRAPEPAWKMSPGQRETCVDVHCKKMVSAVAVCATQPQKVNRTDAYQEKRSVCSAFSTPRLT